MTEYVNAIVGEVDGYLPVSAIALTLSDCATDESMSRSESATSRQATSNAQNL